MTWVDDPETRHFFVHLGDVKYLVHARSMEVALALFREDLGVISADRIEELRLSGICEEDRSAEENDE
jgi:hypothetical protein